MCSGGSDWTCLQPGFPIRKSSDHSLVIDYPRLIADSYVLLRLLMPRHPPCALKNLTTKDQGVISREPQKPTTPQQHHPTRSSHHRAQPDPGSYSWKLLLIKDARVHYVVLKQQPRTTHPTHQPLANSKEVNSVQGVAARKPETHKTHTPHPPPTKRRDRHGPWSCCLRTQQCAKHYPPEPPPQRSTTPSREDPY